MPRTSCVLDLADELDPFGKPKLGSPPGDELGQRPLAGENADPWRADPNPGERLEQTQMALLRPEVGEVADSDGGATGKGQGRHSVVAIAYETQPLAPDSAPDGGLYHRFGVRGDDRRPALDRPDARRIGRQRSASIPEMLRRPITTGIRRA